VLYLNRAMVLIVVLLAWELGSLASHRIDFAISRPSVIGVEVGDLLRGGEVLPHLVATGGAAILGLTIGTLIGTIFGLSTWFSRSTSKLLAPFILALGAMPILAVAPMMIIWFGIGLEMKIALACLSTVFVAFAQSSSGVENISSDYIAVLRGMNATDAQIFRLAIIPGSLNWVFGGMKLNAGLALLGTFIGEFIASNRGLGYLVLRASSLYNVPRAIAAALFIVLLALAFDWLGGFLQRHKNQIIQVLCISREAWKSA
jgi:NitT/TauT family transport system permease protein